MLLGVHPLLWIGHVCIIYYCSRDIDEQESLQHRSFNHGPAAACTSFSCHLRYHAEDHRNPP